MEPQTVKASATWREDLAKIEEDLMASRANNAPADRDASVELQLVIARQLREVLDLARAFAPFIRR